MANDFTNNPFYIEDTATAYEGGVKVLSIHWTGASNGDDLILTDTAGRTIVQHKSDGSDYHGEGYGSFNGITPDTLDGGTVWIYIK